MPFPWTVALPPTAQTFLFFRLIYLAAVNEKCNPCKLHFTTEELTQGCVLSPFPHVTPLDAWAANHQCCQMGWWEGSWLILVCHFSPSSAAKGLQACAAGGATKADPRSCFGKAPVCMKYSPSICLIFSLFSGLLAIRLWIRTFMNPSVNRSERILQKVGGR